MISNEKISAAVVVKKNYDNIEKYCLKFREELEDQCVEKVDTLSLIHLSQCYFKNSPSIFFPFLLAYCGQKSFNRIENLKKQVEYHKIHLALYLSFTEIGLKELGEINFLETHFPGTQGVKNILLKELELTEILKETMKKEVGKIKSIQSLDSVEQAVDRVLSLEKNLLILEGIFYLNQMSLNLFVGCEQKNFLEKRNICVSEFVTAFAQSVASQENRQGFAYTNEKFLEKTSQYELFELMSRKYGSEFGLYKKHTFKKTASSSISIAQASCEIQAQLAFVGQVYNFEKASIDQQHREHTQQIINHTASIRSGIAGELDDRLKRTTAQTMHAQARQDKYNKLANLGSISFDLNAFSRNDPALFDPKQIGLRQKRNHEWHLFLDPNKTDMAPVELYDLTGRPKYSASTPLPGSAIETKQRHELGATDRFLPDLAVSSPMLPLNKKAFLVGEKLLEYVTPSLAQSELPKSSFESIPASISEIESMVEVENQPRRNLGELIRDYHHEGESWVGTTGRFLRESGIREGLDNTFEAIGNSAEVVTKALFSIPERGLRHLAKELGLEVRSGAPYTEQSINALKQAIGTKVTKDAQAIKPALENIVQKYDITPDELSAVQTAIEVLPIAKAGQLAQKGAGNLVRKGLSKLDQRLPQTTAQQMLFSAEGVGVRNLEAGLGTLSTEGKSLSQTQKTALASGIAVASVPILQHAADSSTSSSFSTSSSSFSTSSSEPSMTRTERGLFSQMPPTSEKEDYTTTSRPPHLQPVEATPFPASEISDGQRYEFPITQQTLSESSGFQAHQTDKSALTTPSQLNERDRAMLSQFNVMERSPLLTPDGMSPSVQKSLTKKAEQARQAGFQDHHIISYTNKRTKDHELWKLSGIDIQSRDNRIFLPNKERAEIDEQRSIHEGRHPNKTSERLAEDMDEIVKNGKANGYSQAQYAKDFRALLSEERKNLKQGKVALNKNHRERSTIDVPQKK